MKRIDHATATVDDEFTEGNPGTGTPATRVTAQWLNVLQEEIAHVIEEAGGTLDQTGANRHQLFDAIQDLISSNVGTPPTVQYLKTGTAANYNLPAGCKAIKVRMIGGGGGGGPGTGSDGGDGGDTSFGAWSCKGGLGGRPGGVQRTTPTTGGTGTASFRLAGQNGHLGAWVGGPGGASIFGGSGSPNGGTPVHAVPNTGAGGGGGLITNTTVIGGTGGDAGEYAEIIILSPSSSYTYTIGAGGAGGVHSSNNVDGGNGASGLIIVEEYY